MSKSRFRPATVLSPLFAFTTLLAACGGSTTSGSTGTTASDTAYCNALKSFMTACPPPSFSVSCQQALLAEITDDCAGFVGIASAAYQHAVTTCPPNPSCPYGDPYISTCFENAVQTTALTPAQTKLATDYCNACGASAGQTTPECVTAFYGLIPDAGGPEPGAALGFDADAVIERIDSTCISGGADAGAACESFISCADDVLQAMTPPNPTACTPSADGG
jgi:hypothetical protein